ncbi:MAG: fatty acid metabolism transcriptional regulator FadR [Thermodesulfobacteriota bacterium]
MNFSPTPLIKPARHAEQHIIISILDGTWPPGTQLPGERDMAAQLGVTRQTLRETLQRLARDRWITISHGRPTVVNDYWRTGGMAMLKTMAAFPEYLPTECVVHLLEARAVFLPACAAKAVPAHPELFSSLLETAGDLDESADAFAAYDWNLQIQMAQNSDNRVYPLFLNDFEPVFGLLGGYYFTMEKGRAASRRYYKSLSNAIVRKKKVEPVVRQAMEESIEIWKACQKK